MRRPIFYKNGVAMAGASEGAVNFLNLAYMLEFSLVLNLTYRELKFPELYDVLKEKVESIYQKYTTKSSLNELDDKELDLHPELLELQSLLNPKDVKKGGDEDVEDKWEHKKKEKIFFKQFIKNRCSLSFVNFNIFASLLVLILCTILSNGYGMQVFKNLFCFEINLWGENRAINLQIYWYIIFVFCLYLCLLPLVFIKLETSCEFFFYGKDGKNGVVGEITRKIKKRCLAIERSTKDKNNVAENFTAKDKV